MKNHVLKENLTFYFLKVIINGMDLEQNKILMKE
jgi:hypothetical protein